MFKIRDTVERTYDLKWNNLRCAVSNSVTLSNVREDLRNLG